MSRERLSLGGAIDLHASRRPRDVALVVPGREPLTYAGLAALVAEARDALRGAGLGPQAKIGVALPSGPAAALGIVGVACSAVAVPLDPKLTGPEIVQRLDLIGLDAILLPKGEDPPARAAARQRGIPVIEVAAPPGRLGFALEAPAAPEPAEGACGPGSVAFILQTSGTTALPKLIPFTHRNMLAAAARLRAWFGLGPSDRCLNVSAPYYSHGLKVTIFTPLLTGGSIAIPANPALVDLAEWFDHLRPTWFSAGPTLHRAVLDAARAAPEAREGHTLRFIVSGGAPLGDEVREGLERVLGIPVLEHYGSSEAAQMAANLPRPGQARAGTCGRPWPGTLRIVGEDGRDVPAGERGEVWVGGPTVMGGYVGDPEANAQAFVDGWLRTGDVGSLDQEGFLRLHGRLKEVINRGGEKVSPQEVDEALLRHPAVLEAAAFAVPHPRLGEDVAAAVVLRPGAVLDQAEMRAFLGQGLSSFKVPRRIHAVDALPKGVTGKVQRRRLTESHGAPAAGKAPAAEDVAAGGLEDRVRALWARLLGRETVGLDEDFFEAGGDSLLATEMILELERMAGHGIADSILFENPTIRGVVRRMVEGVDARDEPIVHIQAGGKDPPLLFFHGDYETGAAFYLGRLAGLMGPEQPIIAVAPHGLHGEDIPRTVEEMAADRLALIQAVQPKGPYRIAGFCNGSLVGLEVARLLLAQGQRVEVVAMIDPPSVNARRSARLLLRPLALAEGILPGRAGMRAMAAAWRWMARGEKFGRLCWAGRRALIRSAMAGPASRPGLEALSGGPDAALRARPWPTEPGRVTEHRIALEAVMARYAPAPLPVPIVYYAAEYDGRPWGRIGSEVEVVPVEGGHYGTVTTHATALANHLRQRLGDVADGLRARAA